MLEQTLAGLREAGNGRLDGPRRIQHLLDVAKACNFLGWLHAYVPRAPHDDTVLAALRSRIGDAALGRAWARGRSLTGTHAVRYALEEAGP